MYSNYRNSSLPMNGIDQMPSNVNPYYSNNNISSSNNNRFVGGFLAPFVLGGITGGLLAPAFNQRPYYYNNYYYPYPYPYYGQYYR